MKVVILAGGYGTRLSEYTENMPKPMVEIGGKPIIFHIMMNYSKFGFNHFYIALGYKSEYIKNYFLNFKYINTDIKICMENNKVEVLKPSSLNWTISMINTGLNTMTGGRIKKLKSFISNETFLLTYGDGISDININKLIEFHKSQKKLITVTAVRPMARFGELTIDDDNKVLSFKEKPQINQGWINGGFFVVEPEFLNLIEGDESILEKEPLERALSMGQLAAYKHEGFWQCMDTKRDKDYLETLWNSGVPPWVI